MDSEVQNQPTVTPQPINEQPVEPNNPLKSKLLVVFLGLMALAAVIRVGVYFLEKQEPEQKTAQVVTSPTLTPDPTANWKTYENVGYKYSVEYPSTWEILKSSDTGASFRPIDKKADFPNGVIGIDVRDKTNKDEILSLEEYLRQVVGDETSPSKTLLSLEQVGVGYKVKWKVGAVGPYGKEEITTIAYFNLPGKLIEVYWINKEEQTKEYEQIFNQILSTFKFTDQNQGLSVVTLTGNDSTTVSAFGITTIRPKDFDVFIDNKNNFITYHTTNPKVSNNQIIEIHIKDYDAKKSLIDWWNTSPANNVQGETFTKMTQIHGYEALQTHGKGQVEYDMYYIPHGPKLYAFLMADFDSENNAKAREVLDSLQFTN